MREELPPWVKEAIRGVVWVSLGVGILAGALMVAVVLTITLAGK